MARIRSIESQIKEHEKYRRQCQIRIKPSLQLVGIAAAISAILVWSNPNAWIIALVIVAVPTFGTAMEIFGYFNNARAIQRLKENRDQVPQGKPPSP